MLSQVPHDWIGVDPVFYSPEVLIFCGGYFGGPSGVLETPRARNPGAGVEWKGS